ncbi:putative ribonuclease H-like domain-containing protein [Tanacetum coccineum]
MVVWEKEIVWLLKIQTEKLWSATDNIEEVDWTRNLMMNHPDHLIKDYDLHERTLKQTQTHKPKGTHGSRDTRPVWNNVNRTVLTREGLKSTARPKTTQTVPSKSTASMFYQGTARQRVPQAVLSQNTGRPYYPRMDNIRPRTLSFSPSKRFSTTRTPHRPQRPKKIMKSIWVKKERPNPEGDLQDYVLLTVDVWRKRGRSQEKIPSRNLLLDFEKVSYVEELKFNLLSVSQICDKKHNVLFTDKECLILSPKFKFVDEDLVILRAPRKNDVYSLDLKIFISFLRRRLGHVNFKNINKLVKGNLVRGLPSKTFKLDHSCLACRKGKQHRASCKKIEERTVREPLELLHMDLFGPVSVESVNRKKYCLVVPNDCSKFSWVFFLAYKDETYDMLHDLIVGLENKLRHKVKTISIARTPQQNGIAERKNRTLIEAARTMLADSLLPIQFWAEAVNTACYVIIEFNQLVKFDGQIRRSYLFGTPPATKVFRGLQSDDDVPKKMVFSLQILLMMKLQTLRDGKPGLHQHEESFKKVLSDQLKPFCLFIIQANAGTNQKDQQDLLVLLVFISRGTQEVAQALADEKLVERCQEELLPIQSYKIVWVIILRLVAKGTASGRCDYDEVFAPVARIEANQTLFGHIASLWVYCLSQMRDKYVKAFSTTFDFRTIKPASTPIEAHKSLGKDEEGEEVDVHLYRVSKSLQWFSNAMLLKKIFRYLKHQPKLDDQLQEDVNILEEDWSLGNARNKIIVAINSTEAEYVEAAKLLCPCKGSLMGSKVHTDDNVADLLTKGFDIARFNFLVTAHNADFYQIIDYLTGCSINYSLLVDPDLIGPWLQQFWATASLRVINEVPHIRAMVAGKRILISGKH